MQLNSSKETVHDEGDSGATASAIADEAEQLSSPDDHRAEAMNIVLIRHPSVHYHGSDTFCQKEPDDTETEMEALNPQVSKSNDNITTIDIENDHISEDIDCTEFHSLMTGGVSRKSSGSRSDSLSDV